MGEQQDDSLSPWVWPGDLESVLQGGDTLFKGVRCFVRICTFKFEKPAAKWTKIVLTASLYIYNWFGQHDAGKMLGYQVTCGSGMVRTIGRSTSQLASPMSIPFVRPKPFFASREAGTGWARADPWAHSCAFQLRHSTRSLRNGPGSRTEHD